MEMLGMVCLISSIPVDSANDQLDCDGIGFSHSISAIGILRGVRGIVV